MPSLITHQLVSEKVYIRLSEELKELIKDRGMYYFGAQGGDPFYLYRYITNRKKINFGKALHKGEIFKTFTSFKSYVAESKEMSVYSYVLGYITHYAVDIVFHPFVYYMINKYTDRNDRVRERDKLHYLIEGDIDVYLLKKLKAEDIKNYTYPLTFLDVNILKLYNLFDKVYFDLCSEQLDYYSFEKCVKNFFSYNRLLEDRKFKKQRVFKGIEDFFNLSHLMSYLFKRDTPDERFINVENEIWHNMNYPEETHTKSATDLFYTSVDLSIELIQKFVAAVSGGKDISRTDFSTDFNIGR